MYDYTVENYLTVFRNTTSIETENGNEMYMEISVQFLGNLFETKSTIQSTCAIYSLFFSRCSFEKTEVCNCRVLVQSFALAEVMNFTVLFTKDLQG